MNLTLSQIKARQLYQAINVKNESPDASVHYVFNYVLNLVFTEPFTNVLAEILQLSLDNPFPNEDVRKLERDYESKLGTGSSISGEIDLYWSSIAGIVNRILTGRISGYKQEGRDILKKTFFNLYEPSITFRHITPSYNNLYNEYLIYEKAKMLGLIYISLIDKEFIFIKTSEGN